MDLSLEQVVAMAPDAASAAAGKKLAAIKHWPELGRSPAALWGKCQGSAVYQVRVDLLNLGYNCSCPSRKFPCKHVLGLLMLTVQSPDALAAAETGPEWIESWLEKRRMREEKQASRPPDQPKAPADEKARERRAEQRGATVRDGLARLDLWMKDLVRSGLAGVETRPPAFWEEQSKRLVDAQAPGLASRIARLAALPRSSPDWIAQLLAELGRIKLLTHACQRIDGIDAGLASDVRQMIGWNVSQEELEKNGERLSDTWVVAGQWIDEEERVRAQRSWVVGRKTGRSGLILQFTAGSQPFSESIVAGTEQEGMLVFYPGTARVRAKFVSREGSVSSVQGRLPGCDSVDDFLANFSEVLSRQPWLSAFGGILRGMTILRAEEAWFVRDSGGDALPLAGQNHWKGLAVSGGRPCDLAGEWDGYRLRQLGLFIDGQYWSG